MPPVDSFLCGWIDDPSPHLLVDCLLPTGIIIPLQIKKEAPIEDIKQALWNVAQTYPLYTELKAKHLYVFQCITSMAEKVELEDETCKLRDVKPFQPILKVVERQGDKTEKIANLHISMLIGKGLHEFDNLKSSEVSEFREKMRRLCEDTAEKRDRKPWLDRMNYLYPPDISDVPEFPEHIQQKLGKNRLIIAVWVADIDISYSFQIPCSTQPSELISKVIDKRLSQTGIDLGRTDRFVLKICGRDELLLGDFPLSQFMSIRRSVIKGTTPTVVLLERAEVSENESRPVLPPVKRKPSIAPKSEKVLNNNKYASASSPKGCLSWDIQEKFSFKVHHATNISETNFTKHFQDLSACIYHGPDAMCDVVRSKDLLVKDGCITFDEDLTFNIDVQHIPRMARLCFVLCSVGDKRNKDVKRQYNTGGKKKGKRESSMPLAWVNTALFDYKGILQSGPCTLYMWPASVYDILNDQAAILNPIGTVENNPMGGGAICLSLVFHSFNAETPISFAPFEKVLEVAAQHTDFSSTDSSDSTDKIDRHVSTLMDPLDIFHKKLDEKKNVDQQLLEQLRVLVDRDSLTELHENEKQQIWTLRLECQYKYPNSLPVLLRCVQWDNYLEVAQMQALLQIWPLLKPEYALELLDFVYANKEVRIFAVKCLEELSDLQLKHYMLQLVQVLKYESYLNCDLVDFLLRRALSNQRIGHHLFWLLKSEMHVPSVSVRFGLILEAYCRGSASHIPYLITQTMAMDKFKRLSEKVKAEVKGKGKEIMLAFLDEHLLKNDMHNLQSLLDPGHKLKSPRKEKCKVMDSKMRPLYLVFENKDIYGEAVHLMYKNGDDLRQDMLTLQILRIFDVIWQEAGLDLRLNAYGCMSTAQSEGIIEIVTESATIANIQKEHPGISLKKAFNKKSLYQWLKTHNDTEETLEKAMNEFRYSCAGYCVAMYVLGVGDRHGDNILMKRNGQLFHIDFGHFLGNFKSKFGMNRDAAPFQLTSEFVFLLQRGPKQDNNAFESFKKVCEEAYMALRKKSNFLISLFMMMMNTGIPQLSSSKDIEYLKKTLVPNVSESEARDHFHKQIKLALGQAWKVAINNTFHNFARDNPT